MDMIHEVDIAYLLAIMERTCADAERGFRDVDLLQRDTTVERFVANGIESVRQVDAVETRAALEGLLDATPSGMTTLRKVAQPAKACSPMKVRVGGRSMASILLQPAKAPASSRRK